MGARLLLVVLLGAFLALPAAGARSTSLEIAFTASLDLAGSPTAVCVGTAGDLGHAQRLTGHGYAGATWSPDGEQLAVGGGRPNSRIRIEPAGGGSLRAVTHPRRNEDDSNPAWSPDGTRIAFSRYVYYDGRHTKYRRAGIWMVNLATGRERQLARRFGGPLAWSPTGDVIAADLGHDGGETIELLAPDGQVVNRFVLSSLGTFDGGASWSPDGRLLAVGGGAIINRSGTIVAHYGPPSDNDAVSREPSWAPDGSIVFERSPTIYYARINVRTLGPADLYLTPPGGEPVPLTQTPVVSEGVPAVRPGSATAAGAARPCVLVGTPGNDTLRGTSGDDLIYGRAGDDTIDGGPGADFIEGGNGDDVIRGGPGHDSVFGGLGNDRLFARDHTRDFVGGGRGHDVAVVDRGLDGIGAGVEVVLPRR